MKPENFMLGLGLAAMVVAMTLAFHRDDEKPPAQEAPLPATNIRYQPYVFLDEITGCQYLSTHTSAALTPRIAADGKSHMGCKGN